MTEAEWLACDDPDPLLNLLGSGVGDRKRRLFAVACCRLVIQHLWAREWSRTAVEIAERCAESLATIEDLDAARNNVESRLELYPGEPVYDASYWACNRDIVEGASMCAFYAANLSTIVVDHTKADPDFDKKCDAVRRETCRSQVRVFHEIFGNPFRPVTFDPEWRTQDVKLLAQGIYEEKAFDRMPILADALQDAGCDNDDILSHCRDTQLLHVRGCWVVDGVLGKV